MDPSKESFMNLNQAEQRRNFIKLAFGVSSAAWAAWSSANSTASTFKGSSLETQLLRLPPNTEPMVISGRVIGPQNKPCCDQSVMTNSQQIVTDADGRFWLETNTTELQSSHIQSSDRIVNHQLTQDSAGVWRLYLELSA